MSVLGGPLEPSIITPFVHSCPVDHSGTVVQVAGWHSNWTQIEAKTSGNPRRTTGPGATAATQDGSIESAASSSSYPVLCLHDFGESASLYKGALEFLAGAGVSAYGFDMRGHGDNQAGFTGARGLQAFQRDLLQVAALVKHAEDGLAPVLVANGLSGILALRVAKAYPRLVGGVIMIDPPHHSIAEVSRLRHGFTKALAEFLPDLELPVKLLSAKKILRAAANGPMSAATAHELFEAVAKIPGQLSDLAEAGCKCLVIVHNRDQRKVWLDDMSESRGKNPRLTVQYDPSGPPGYLPIQLISEWMLP